MKLNLHYAPYTAYPKVTMLSSNKQHYEQNPLQSNCKIVKLCRFCFGQPDCNSYIKDLHLNHFTVKLVTSALGHSLYLEKSY